MRKRFIVAILAVVLLGVGVVGFFFVTDAMLKSALPKVYAHPVSGYGFRYPPGWIMDTTRQQYTIDVLKHESGQAFIFFDIINDEALAAEGGIFILERKIKEAFETNPKYHLAASETVRWHGREALKFSGTRDGDDGTWQFYQYVAFTRASPKAFNITASINTDAGEERVKEALAILRAISFTK